MGLLDEAIREHLDLKRRRGADPAEIERAEREALGPVRRHPEPERSERPEAIDHADPAAGLADGMPPETPEPDEDLVPEPEFEAEAVEPELEEELSELPPPDVGIPESSSEVLGPETVEYDVEREHAGAANPEAAEDMLEETPDFLQDTPDHDRLWFEQRPPRDFDFEG